MFEVIILSIVQGITEFLPISSTSHLIIFSEYFNFKNENLSLDLSLHFGSLLAIVLYFRKELFNYINNKELFLKIALSSIPVIIIGFFVIKLNIVDHFRNYTVIGWSTLLFGVLLFFSDQIKVKKKFYKDFRYSSAVYIGFFQILAIIPGVSRSGIVMTGARFLKFNRIDAAKISFLMSIPTLIIASLHNFYVLTTQNNFEVSILNLVGIFFSFIFSYVTIKYFLKFLQKFNLSVFVIYRIILGLIIINYV